MTMFKILILIFIIVEIMYLIKYVYSNIQKYVFEGTYVEELDTFMTTSMAVNQRLEEIPKYAKYMRTIRNIEKSIEKFAYSLDITSYLGNDPIIKLRRKMIIKDIIDLVNRDDKFKKQKLDIFIFVHPLAIFGNIFHRKNRRKMSKKIIVYSQYKIVVKLIYRLEYFVTVAIFSIAIADFSICLR